jgi:hypothetical protein
MTIDEFNATLADAEPPAVSAVLRATWYAANHRWDGAHQIEATDSLEDEWSRIATELLRTF